MLAERNEWRQVHDIVKLTMKALCDVVRTQGSALREVERQIPLLATKAHLDEQIMTKPSIDEVQRVISELEQQIQSPPSLDDKVSRVDL